MITFISPPPFKERNSDGYLSRVIDIDHHFFDRNRTYIEIHTPPTQSHNHFKSTVKDGINYLQINWNSGAARSKLDEILHKSDIIYCHSIYQARFILPYFKTKFIIVDMHGAVPEENYFYQDKSQFNELNKIEDFICRNAKSLIVVSESMREHFQVKYPFYKMNFIVIPISQQIAELKLNAKKKNTFLYSGGSQKWQNLEKIYSFVRTSPDNFHFIFLSPDYKKIIEELRKRNLLYKCDVQYSHDISDLSIYYDEAQFGFILRDDNVVNRVACPTKLFEYLNCGIVPVVDSPKIGDFERLGYRYIYFNQLLESQFKEPNWEQYARHNLLVLNEISKKRELGIQDLKQLVQSNLNRSNSQDELPVPSSLYDACFSISPIYQNMADHSQSQNFLINRGHYQIQIPIGTFDVEQLEGIQIHPAKYPCHLVLHKSFTMEPGGSEINHLRFTDTNGIKKGNKFAFKGKYPCITFKFEKKQPISNTSILGLEFDIVLPQYEPSLLQKFLIKTQPIRRRLKGVRR